jgi:formiminoglutamase
MNITYYTPPNPQLWSGREDSLTNERYFQQIQFIDLSKDIHIQPASIILIGYASDVGVIRNLGRHGANMGPDVFKRQIAKLPRHHTTPIYDAGNFICPDDNLEGMQDTLTQAITKLQAQGHFTFVIGGSHDLAFPHYMGIQAVHPDTCIINFDAHFDLRPLPKENYGTSGTPFCQIATARQKDGNPFNYACLGIQPQGNTKSLFDEAMRLHVSHLDLMELFLKPMDMQYAFLDKFIRPHKKIYITLCLDVFSSAYAPGVSAASPLGLEPKHAICLLQYLQQTGKVVGMDIAELSPPLDENEKTSKLAAQLMSIWY